MKKIPVARPTVGKVERDLVMNCLETTWISSAGQYVDQFERDFAHRIGARHAISVSNGTCALHLALLGLELQPGDEVSFEPGGKHVMAFEVSPELQPGGTTEVTLTIAGGDKHSFEVPVMAAGEER